MIENSTYPQTDLAIYRRLLALVKGSSWVFVVALFGFLLAAVAEGVFVQSIGGVIDIFSDRSQPGSIPRLADLLGTLTFPDYYKYPAIIIVAAIFRALGHVIGEYLLSRVSFSVIHKVRCALFDKLLVVPSQYFVSNKQGEITNRLTDTTSKLRDTVTDVLRIAFQDCIRLGVFLTLMLITNFALTLLWLVIAPIVGVIVRFASRRFRRISKRIQDTMGDLTHLVEEAVGGFKTIRVYRGQSQTAQEFNVASNHNRSQNLKMVATKAFSTQTIQLLTAIALGVLVGTLFVPSLSEGMTAGQLVEYIGYAALMANPIKRLSELNAKFQQGMAAAHEIFVHVDQPSEPDFGTFSKQSINGRIEFRNVSYAYPGSTESVLKNISLIIEPGETIAVVGSSGGGKTTLSELLQGLLVATDGQILVDDVPIHEYALANLRSHIAVVSQDVFLFNKTLRDNVAYGGQANASSDAFADALRGARVDEFLPRLLHGEDTQLGDRGNVLSQGQRQRVAIARALLKEAPIVVLDEATSALDAESETLLQEALQSVMQDRTTVVIAHRLSTVTNADRIVVIESGEIVEVGSHETLVKDSGRYAELIEKQGLRTDVVHAEKTKVDQIPLIPIRRELSVESELVSSWYQGKSWLLLLRPFSLLFGYLVERRRNLYQSGKKATWRAPVPVVVVGNITVGGTGKTPLTIWLANQLCARGIKVGIVHSGYAGTAKQPVAVHKDIDVSVSGDESLVLAERTECPVVCHRDRVQAVQHLLATNTIELVISDDGLQHYALERDYEIVVVDGQRAFGNNRLLPEGPMREPLDRLDDVDWVVCNTKRLDIVSSESTFKPIASQFRNISSGEVLSVSQWHERFPGKIYAIAGIGNPQSFLDILNEMGIQAELFAFDDHKRFSSRDLPISQGQVVVVTEKDAVKLKNLNVDLSNMWVLPIDIQFDDSCESNERIRELVELVSNTNPSATRPMN